MGGLCRRMSLSDIRPTFIELKVRGGGVFVSAIMNPMKGTLR